MPSRKTPPKISAVNTYDDNSFITEENSSREQAADNTCRPEFPPAEDRGFNFQPFNVPPRDLKVNPLPQEPLQLFQLFVPVSLVKIWVEYTNNWVASLHESGVIDSQNHELKDGSRVQKWTRLKVSYVYTWLGILIYIGLRKETRIEDH